MFIHKKLPILAAYTLLAVAGLQARTVSAITYDLRAAVSTKLMPDGQAVTVWGFADDTAGGPGSGAVRVPGPVLRVPPGDNTLTINLRNELTEAATGVTGGVPISLVIPGQIAALQPVRFSDAQGRARARAFTAEAGPGASASYTWNNLRPGSYLYHSGSHPAVQVPMGLHGALIKDEGRYRAYPGVLYDNEVVLIFSEFDPALSAALSSGTYGSPAYPSALQYNPKYFMVNGQPFSGDPADLGSAPIVEHEIGYNEHVLVRLLNAGLKTHMPALHGAYLQLLAEDGNPYPYAREQYSVQLPALKSIDAILTSSMPITIPILDRALHLTNDASGPGGIMTKLTIGTGLPVIAVVDRYSLQEDSALEIPAPGLLENDSATGGRVSVVLDNPPASGSLTFGGDGSFRYIPRPDYNGSDSFTYHVVAHDISSQPGVAVINVEPVNDAPSAVDDSHNVVPNRVLAVAGPGVLGNDSDIDSTVLTASLDAAPQHGELTLNPDGSFRYKPDANFKGKDSFTYQVSDGAALSNLASVTLSVTAAPAAVDDNASVRRNGTVNIKVLRNDSDPDGTLDPATVTVTEAPSHGAAAALADGSIVYTPHPGYRGRDLFRYTVRDNLGAVSNVASVSMAVTTRGGILALPVARNDHARINRNKSAKINILRNDSHVKGKLNPRSVVVVRNPLHGSVILLRGGRAAYRPAEGYVGRDSFSYTVNDMSGATSNEAVVSVNVYKGTRQKGRKR